MIANYVNTSMRTKCQRTMNRASHLRWHLFSKIAEIPFAEIQNSRLVDRVLVCHYISIGVIGVKHCYFVIWLRSVMSGLESEKNTVWRFRDVSRSEFDCPHLHPHPFIWLPAPVPFMRFEIWLWCECYAVAVSYGCILCIELELIGRKSHNLN